MRAAYWKGSTIFPDLIGVAKFHIAEMRSGWVPSVLRGLGVLTYRIEAQYVYRPSHHRINSPFDDLGISKPHQGFICIRPSELLLARFGSAVDPLLRR